MEHINKGIKCFELSHTPAHSFPSLHPSGGCSCSQGNNLLGWWLWKSTTSWTGWRTETAQNVLLHIGICRWSHTILCLLAQQPLMKTSVLKLVKYFAWSLLFFFFLGISHCLPADLLFHILCIIHVWMPFYMHMPDSISFTPLCPTPSDFPTFLLTDLWDKDDRIKKIVVTVKQQDLVDG